MTFTCSAFIDVLGIRALASRSDEQFWQVLKTFHSQIWGHAKGKEEKTAESGSNQEPLRVLFLSDSIFVQSADGVALLETIQSLRAELMQQGIFVKGALDEGALDDFDAQFISDEQGYATQTSSESASPMHCRLITGFGLGKKASFLYGRQERLKGAGVWVLDGFKSKLSSEIKDSSSKQCQSGQMLDSKQCELEQMLVDSVYIPRDGDGTAEHFVDIRISEAYRNAYIFEKVLTAFIDAMASGPSQARYYVSLLVTWVQSVPVDKVNDDRLIDSVRTGELKTLFRTCSGYEQVYFATLARLLRSPSSNRNTELEEFADKLMRDQSHDSELRHVPLALFDHECRKRYSESRSRVVMEAVCKEKSGSR